MLALGLALLDLDLGLNEVQGHLSGMAGEAPTQLHHLVHLCLCSFCHCDSWPHYPSHRTCL